MHVGCGHKRQLTEIIDCSSSPGPSSGKTYGLSGSAIARYSRDRRRWACVVPRKKMAVVVQCQGSGFRDSSGLEPTCSRESDSTYPVPGTPTTHQNASRVPPNWKFVVLHQSPNLRQRSACTLHLKLILRSSTLGRLGIACDCGLLNAHKIISSFYYLFSLDFF